MTQVILDSVLRSKLMDLNQPLDLCDESGRVLARLIPVADPKDYEPVQPRISREELERRRQSTDWRTFKDVLKRLGNE